MAELTWPHITRPGGVGVIGSPVWVDLYLLEKALALHERGASYPSLFYPFIHLIFKGRDILTPPE